MFITLTNKRNDKPVTINLRHVNVIEPREDGTTHLGINNPGALGYNVLESYETVRAMVEGMPSR